MQGIAADVTQLIGNTPLLYLNKVVAAGPGGRVAAKLEIMEPCCSIKDRVALGMIEQAEQAGKLEPGKSTLVAPVSGHLGVSLACVAAARGYRLIIVMPASSSLERKVLIRAFGAQLVLTDPCEGMKGALGKAQQLARTTPAAHLLQQLSSPEAPEVDWHVHYRTTGPEIWEATLGSVDVLVAGVGGGGALTGAARFLKEKKPGIKVVAVEPAELPMLAEAARLAAHKAAAGVAPAVALDPCVIDETIQVGYDDACLMARRLALEEGLLTGVASGAAVKAATDLAVRQEHQQQLIVVILPSYGERSFASVMNHQSHASPAQAHSTAAVMQQPDG